VVVAADAGKPHPSDRAGNAGPFRFKGVHMAKTNFRQQKRQRELARKQRQDERLLRRGERPVADAAAALTGSEARPAGSQS
jgi:hypothetical protein